MKKHASQHVASVAGLVLPLANPAKLASKNQLQYGKNEFGRGRDAKHFEQRIVLTFYF